MKPQTYCLQYNDVNVNGVKWYLNYKSSNVITL